MENIIEELLKIENMAQDIVRKTESEQKNLSKLIAEKCIEIEIAINNETEQKLHELRIRYSEESNDRINQIVTKTQSKFSEMEMEFDLNSDKWEEEIFTKIKNNLCNQYNLSR